MGSSLRARRCLGLLHVADVKLDCIEGILCLVAHYFLEGVQTDPRNGSNVSTLEPPRHMSVTTKADLECENASAR